MSSYTRAQFGATVREDFSRRRATQSVDKSMWASAALETKALGHPDYETLAIGERRTAPMVTVFLDLTNFTGRTFWDDQDEVVDLAHAVLSGFIEVTTLFGGHPLGLRGDGLFAGFSPGQPDVTCAMALSACAFALDGIEREVNPWLDERGIARIQARAGLDYGRTTFVRSGSHKRSEINPLGFAANFAAKCEKKAKSWEIVVGQGLRDLLPTYQDFVEHDDSPKVYTRNYESKHYRYYEYRWRNTLPLLPGAVSQLDGTPTSLISTQ
ncbi:adenylate/guanylate cyclase domain-containing protein [Janibacter melonis]|nr:adenylate/guanylate cyclase domain-containing protein [Janibacter melonis]